MSRPLADIQADIDRCQWLRTHVHDLDAALRQDQALAALIAERDAAATAAGRAS